MNSSLRVVVAVGWLLGGASSAAAQSVLYVDGAKGDDSIPRSANSQAKPWKSIGRAAWGTSDRNAPNAAEAAQAGDTVLVAPGVYSMSATGRARHIPLYNPANSGRPDRPIAFRAQGRVTLQSPEYSGPVIGTHQRTHIVWDGFHIDEANVRITPDTGPVVVWASSFVTIENLEIIGTYAPFLDNHNGIRLEASDNNIIRGNVVSGFGVMRNGQQARTRNASAITLYDSNTNVIEHNELTACGTGVFIKGVKIGRGQNGNVVRYNSISKLGPGGMSVGVIVQTSSNAEIYQNVIANVDVAFEIESLARPGQHPSGDVIANNTIHEAGMAAFRLRGPTQWVNVRVFNNLVFGSRYAVLSDEQQRPGDVSFQHNIYAGLAKNFASFKGHEHNFSGWQRTFNQDNAEPTSLTGDPKFSGAKTMDLRLCTGRGQPSPGCREASPGLQLGVDILDLNRDRSNSDPIRPGAYVTGDEKIGRVRGAGPSK